MDLIARLIASAKIGVMSFRSIQKETKYSSAWVGYRETSPI